MMQIEASDPLAGSSYDVGVTVKAEVKQEDEDENFSAIRKVSRVSGRQIEVLCEFLNFNRDVATAHNRSLQDKEYSQKKWVEIASILNAQGDGAYKDWRGWSKYWIDYKAKLKTKVVALRGCNGQSGGGPFTERPFTPVEEKFLHILGYDVTQGCVSGRDDHNIPRSIWLEPCKDFMERGGVLINMEVQDSSDSIPHASPNSNQLPEPVEESKTHSHSSENARSSVSSPSHNNTRVESPRGRPGGNPPLRRPGRGRGRRFVSLGAARRALLRSAQMRAEAAVRSCEALEQMVEHMAQLKSTAKEFVSVLKAAFPSAASTGNTS